MQVMRQVCVAVLVLILRIVQVPEIRVALHVLIYVPIAQHIRRGRLRRYERLAAEVAVGLLWRLVHTLGLR